MSSTPHPTTDADDRPDRDDMLKRLEKLEAANERRAKTIAEQNQRITVLEQALASMAAPDKDHLPADELPDHAERQGRRIQRTDCGVRKLSRQLDEIGADEDGKQWTTNERVHAIRKYLVRRDAEQGGFAMDYNAIHSFFADADGDGISPSWASQLLTEAADGHEAFEKDEAPDGTTRLVVDRDKIAEGSILSVKNSDGDDGG